MRIKKIQIKNFKSLVDFELEDLKPFCAFVGPNASGKSNIFEALDFINYFVKYNFAASNIFGDKKSILSFKERKHPHNTVLSPVPSYVAFDINFGDFIFISLDASFEDSDSIDCCTSKNTFENKSNIKPLGILDIINYSKRKKFIKNWKTIGNQYENDYECFIDNFLRIFVGKTSLNRIPSEKNTLASDASNLSQVIGKIFEDEIISADFINWLRILIPEFKTIEVRKSNIDGSFEFFLYEKSSNKPFPKYLISDGTYNILALMAAVYQNSQPQFLCIEEPENGLHPQAIQLLVDFFREKCEEKDHHIWLNTHSQTLVRCLAIDEIILVNKVNGETRAKQLTKEDNIDIKTDEAWLSNALGGGVLW